MTQVQDKSTLTPVLEEWYNQGVQQLLAGRWEEAEAIYRRIIAERPNIADVYYNLGVALMGQQRPDEALDMARRALALRPSFSDACSNLSGTLMATNRPVQAVEVCRQALTTLERDTAAAWNNLAVALKDSGQLDEALAAFDRGIAMQPEVAGMRSNRLYALMFHPAYDDVKLFQELRQWNDAFAKPLAGEHKRFENDRGPDRRLRVGYVSADFRAHCQSLFTSPLFAWHDHGDFEIYCYSGVLAPDAVTARLRGSADAWRDMAGLDDAAVAQMVQGDKIDILVDLTMHMTHSRLLSFARKPAPVQVTWLAYPGSTGLDAIDYRFTDPRLDPPENPEIRNSKFEIRNNDPNSNVPISNGPGERPKPLDHSNIGALEFDSNFEFRISNFATKEPQYSERSVRLPDTFWCYDPRGMSAHSSADLPEPGPLPALAAGHVTFGCLNNFCKASDQSLATWAKVMAALPNSHLILLSPPGPHRDLVVGKLGVTGQRVQFVAYQPRARYLETYRRIDLCLDTLPYNGHTTSLDALWMGVPVVTQVGHTVAGRAGWSQLFNLGLTDLVARSEEQFVKIAVEWASDLPRLEGLRQSLRERMRQSPLMDGPRFAGNMEAAYRQMWHLWCQGRWRG